jgi:signal-transduction protein with cAMP-binding, CBS, and nucleotidyltransferase domain
MAYPSPFSRKVRDVMTRGVVTVGFQDSIETLLEQMSRNGVTAVVVVDPSDETMGIVSTFDVVRLFRDRSKEEIRGMTVEDLMTPQVECIDPAAGLEEAAEVMLEKKIHRLVIFSSHSGRVPVGILSSSDLVRVLHEDLKT